VSKILLLILVRFILFLYIVMMCAILALRYLNILAWNHFQLIAAKY